MKNTWKEINIPDLTGKVIIVTGSNSGLGFEALKMFAKKGAVTIMASRNVERCETAKEKILQDFPEAKIETMKLDLGNLESVRNFVKEFKSKYLTKSPLHKDNLTKIYPKTNDLM